MFGLKVSNSKGSIGLVQRQLYHRKSLEFTGSTTLLALTLLTLQKAPLSRIFSTLTAGQPISVQ